MRPIRSSLLCAFSFIILSSSCQLLRPYRSPLTPTPGEWKNSSLDYSTSTQESLPSNSYPPVPHLSELGQSEETTTTKDAPPPPPSIEQLKKDLCNWWEIFNDPTLNELENQALDSSYTLYAALERVIQARAQASFNFAPLLPHINFSPSFSRSGSLFENPFFTGGSGGGSSSIKKLPHSLSGLEELAQRAAKKQAASSSSSLSNIPGDFRFIQSQYLFPLNLSYELDIWNQVHNAFFASVNQSQASYQAYLSVLLSLTADVANAYFQARGLDTQHKVVQNNIRMREKAVQLNEDRYKAGLIVYMDVSKAVVELARGRSDDDDIVRARGIQENVLATLIGVPPSVFSLPYAPLETPPPIVPSGIPSELLCRRPDIIEAERKLAAAYREIGVAYANFFPSFSINTAIGFQSPFAPQLFSWKSRLWEIGWQCVQTVFDAGRNEANYEYYKSLYRESMANYQETALQAFKDVEDALVNLKGYKKQSEDLFNAVKYARITLEIAQLRYSRGLSNYLEVVDAERQLLETEQNSAIILGNRYISTVMLIRALGGGWEEEWIEESSPCIDPK